jgi:isoquinoline 1-oxidoreductase beta subunit
MMHRTRLSRRDFLKSASAISIGFCLPLGHADGHASKVLAPNAWIRIGSDGAVVLYAPVDELGQGSMTSLPMILAEEMDADWESVSIQMSPSLPQLYGNPKFGFRMLAVASFATAGYFTALRLAGATAKAAVLQRAAALWNVPRQELRAAHGRVLHGPSGRSESFGRFVTVPGEFPPPVVTERDLKPVADFRLIGSHVVRRDLPAKVAGNAGYAMNQSPPGMVFATVLHSPIHGAPLEAIDEAAAKQVAGYVGHRVLPSGVAVIATSTQAALTAARALEVKWRLTDAQRAVDSAALGLRFLAAAVDPSAPAHHWDQGGDLQAGFAAATQVAEATYRSDYAYHAQIEPLNAVARVDAVAGTAEVWAGTQAPAYAVEAVSHALGLPAEAVTLHRAYVGGGFGRRAAYDQDYVVEAALLSQALGKPVKVTWSREEDLRAGRFRPQTAQWLKGGVAAGQLIAWHHRIASEEALAMADPPRFEKADRKPIISMAGSELDTYRVEHRCTSHVRQHTHVRLAPLRGIGATPAHFARECFIDELAAASRVDPLEFRAKLLAHDQRALAVLDKVAGMSNWRGSPPEAGLGLAFSSYGGAYMALVAQVEVSAANGEVKVRNVWAAVDAGLIIQPEAALGQIEGGLCFGVSQALKERIIIENGVVAQSNFHEYPILRMSEVPKMSIELVRSTASPSGLGEITAILPPAAIGNSIYRRTGKRLRHMPFISERVMDAFRSTET